MDSYTLFGHIVEYVGSNMCSRAHVELQALGILPEASLQNNPPLQQDDADLRAAFALWCGLCIDPLNDLASKNFFKAIDSGLAAVPTSNDGENFIETLASILRLGPIESRVSEIYVGPVMVDEEGLHCNAQIIHADGTGTTYTAGHPMPFQVHRGTILDDLKLIVIHRDLRETPRRWKSESMEHTAQLDFVGGLIHVNRNEDRK